MKKFLFTISVCLVISAQAQIKLMPDIPIQIDFYHPMGYKDSIIIGLSLNADDGFDEGLDVIDTSALAFPLDVRIYDPMVQQQFGGPAYNLKHSYLSLPNVPRGKVLDHYKAFQVIVTSDDINFNIGPNNQNNCETLSQGMGSTYFKGKTHFFESYEFQNNEGWAGGGLGVFSDNVFFNANFDIFLTGFREDRCVSINSENIGTKVAYLTFDIELINQLFQWPVSVLENQSNLQIQISNNQLSIQNSQPVTNVYLYNLNGILLFSDVNNNQHIYQSTLPNLVTAQPYILSLANKNKHILYNHKFFIP